MKTSHHHLHDHVLRSTTHFHNTGRENRRMHFPLIHCHSLSILLAWIALCNCLPSGSYTFSLNRFRQEHPPPLPDKSMNSTHTGMSFFSNRKKIMLVGSSITRLSFSVEHHGWGAQLAHWYSRSADVLNRGAGGYTSRWIRQYFHQLLGNEKPDLSVLFIGNNDAIHESEVQRHVPLDEYRENIMALLQGFYKVNKKMIVILVTTSEVNERLKPKHSNARRAQYADVLRDIVSQHHLHAFDHLPIPRRLELVDLMADDAFHIGVEDLCDAAHFNKNGNQKLFEALKVCINNHFPHLSPDVLAKAQSNGTEGEAAGLKRQRSIDSTMPPAAKRERQHSESNEDLVDTPLQLTVPPHRFLV